ncbi:hypothetical protein B6D60_03515 [candidate division KSB1 bacterium 4484_87]|nr:MAG: hypothetical protein B6D60_03515 [candidate division KSB1 bacterium 4484_87]
MARHYIRHYYLNDTIYFLTVHTVKRKCLLDSDERKKVLFETITKIFRKNNYHLYAWAIFDDHFHLLFKTRIGKHFPEIVKAIGVHCAAEIKNLESKHRIGTLFFNYWDICLRTKDEFYRYFNLIHCNAQKHGYAKRDGKYIFSSFRFWQWRRNDIWLKQLQKDFPIDGLKLKEDESLHQVSEIVARG